MKALITGGSSGIGAVTAKAFASAGIGVFLVSENGAALDATAAEIRASGGAADVCVADFSKPEQVEGLLARLEAEFGQIDILINNAGVGLSASAAETKPEDLRFLFEVNFFALASLCRQALTIMGARQTGRIINVSSAAGRLGSSGVSAYSATKGAVHAYSQAIRPEAAHVGVCVTEVLPISVKTPFFDSARGEKYQPQGIVITPEQVAQAILRVATMPRPPAEMLPYRPIKLGFLVESLMPNIFARFMARQYQRSHR
jgi:short-subunit dehydrogenase